MAFGIEREETGEDFVAEVGGPEQAALVSVIVLVGFVQEDRRCAHGEDVPAIGFEHGAVYRGMQLAQALDTGPERLAVCAAGSTPHPVNRGTLLFLG
jgi:hypothetical protein